MTSIASRDLRNHTAKVLAEVAGGGHVTVTVHGRPVAEIIPARASKPRFLSRAEFLDGFTQADADLRNDLIALGDETTDDLDDLR